jgi:hypothetical protein
MLQCGKGYSTLPAAELPEGNRGFCEWLASMTERRFSSVARSLGNQIDNSPPTTTQSHNAEVFVALKIVDAW